MNRRQVLRGIGGLTMALPFLETFAARTASAAVASPFLVVIHQGNGVSQGINSGADEPDLFWPTALGPLTKDTLADRAVSVLADYADRMLVVKGIGHPVFSDAPGGCGHTRAGATCLTAARYTNENGIGYLTTSLGESIDSRIARDFHPGVEPLTLYAGTRSDDYLSEFLSYRGPEDRRAAEHNPQYAFEQMFGLADLEESAFVRLKVERQSVNDLVRDQMHSLLARKDLSKSDRDRLDLHFQSIRDLEKNLCSPDFSPEAKAQMDALSLDGGYEANDNMEAVVKLHMDIIALAVSCGVVRAATLQVGRPAVNTQFFVNGERLEYQYHWISHRIQSNGAEGDPIPDAHLLHHEIDKVHGGFTHYMCEKLDSYTGGGGSLLDSGAVVWLNSLATGQHATDNHVPHVVIGSCAGFLKTGHFIDAGGVTNNKILNTLGAAVGCKNADGDPLDDFGDPELEKGLIEQMLA